LLRAGGSLAGPVFVFYAMTAPLLVHVFTQQLAILRIKQPNLPGIPLHLHSSSDPSGRGAVVSRLNLHASVQMNGTLAI
jgi:hypothetical protein